VRLAALSAGQVQAVPLDPGDRFRAMDEGFPLLLELGKVIPEFPFSTLAASKTLVAAKPDSIVGVLRALARAQDYIREDLDRAVELGKAHGLGGEADVQRRALAYTADDLHVNLKRENLAALLAARGLSATTDTVFDDTFLRRAGLAP
jgi:ABC-type nitrate/sulfonate/bicarbonate transport system substrate-binding protein